MQDARQKVKGQSLSLMSNTNEGARLGSSVCVLQTRLRRKGTIVRGGVAALRDCLKKERKNPHFLAGHCHF